MIHLYAIARRPSAPAHVRGLDGAALVVVPCGQLEAVVTEHDRAPSVEREAALTHAAVVAALAEHGPVLPVRFGVAHTDVASLQAAVRGAEHGLQRSLERVGGHLEFVVREVAHHRAEAGGSTQRRARTEPRSEAPGRAYLEARLAEERAARQAEQVATAELRALTSPLDRYAAVVVERIGPGGPERCYLVDRALLGAFTAAASACLEGRRELILGGPWPPYTFATEELGS